MIYFSIDCEASGPIPPLYSMLSLGATVVRPDGDHHVPSDFSMYLETYDTANKVRQWKYYQLGSRLKGSNEVWSHHFVVSTNYAYESAIDMTKINKIVLKFVASTSNWEFSIDDLRAYPNQALFPNGAVILTFDGPYQGVFSWAEPKLDEYNSKVVKATSRSNLVGKPTIEQRLPDLYAKGWDICVYGRLFDESDTTKYLPAATIAENTLAEKAWLCARRRLSASGRPKKRLYPDRHDDSATPAYRLGVAEPA